MELNILGLRVSMFEDVSFSRGGSWVFCNLAIIRKYSPQTSDMEQKKQKVGLDHIPCAQKCHIQILPVELSRVIAPQISRMIVGDR